jgi:hypothetical protein
LIQEAGSRAKAVEAKREELASVPGGNPLTSEDVAAIRAIGDNTGCMTLKGASSEHEGDAEPDRWPLDEELAAVAARWEIDPERDLAHR